MKSWAKTLIFISVLCMCLFTCLGYAATTGSLSIHGDFEATPPHALFITSVTTDSTLGGEVVSSDYISTTVISSISLGNNENSTVTLHVMVFNNTLDYYKFSNIEYLDNEATYSNKDIIFEATADYRGETRLMPGKYADIDITFQYADYPISSSELTSMLNIHFHLVGEQDNAAVDYDEYIELFLKNGRYGLNDNSNQAKSIRDAIKQYGLVYANDNLQGTNLKNLVSAVNTDLTEDLTFVYQYVSDTELFLYTYEEKHNDSSSINQPIVVYKTTFTYGENSAGVTQWNPSAFERGSATIKEIKTPKGARLYAIDVETWTKG